MMSTTINRELFEALKEAKVSEEKAYAAAETDMSIHQDLADIKARLSLSEKLQWVVIAGVVGLLLKSFMA